MISKSTRFEIFKRDGFQCQYCGRRPADVVLEVDHIDPKANGGSDDEMNLITSCADCNRGKGARRLGEIHPRPDADLEYLRVQQEIAEAQRYLAASKALAAVRYQVIEHLSQIWRECFFVGPPNELQWNRWLSFGRAEEIEYAVRQTAPRFNDRLFGGLSTSGAFTAACRYITGIIRTRQKQEAERAIKPLEAEEDNGF